MTWDRVVDVVVVGTGGAALTAATLARDQGSEVAVLEKAAMVGGTTAVSGGVMWMPCNHLMAAAGNSDTRHAALSYLRRLADRAPDPALLEIFVDAAPVALRYLEDHTPVKTHVTPLSDYYAPWGIPGSQSVPGRAVEADPFPVGAELPHWADRLVKRGTLMSLGAATTLTEDMSPPTAELAAELRRREEEDVRPKGAALIARLLKGLIERGVEPELSSPVKELVLDGSGAVVGVSALQGGRERRIGARKGVILACGGFEWNPELVRAYIGYDVKPLSPPNNVGDGLNMAVAAGARLANMDSYWGTPAMIDPAIVRDGEPVPQFEWARGAPTSIVVNQRGERFANEALPYNDFPKAFGTYDADRAEFPNTAPAYLIFDWSVRSTQRIMSMLPGGEDREWAFRADSIRELAGLISVDQDALASTIERWNDHAARREDPDHHRHERGLIVPGRVAPISAPPFYAVAIYPGALGTNGGPQIDEQGRVRRRGGGVIDGLYAAGNAAANIFGWAYPSAGCTIAPGVVMGFIAGRSAGGRAARAV